ncbi:glycosyltransferase family 2 protein [Brevibacillus laterosporus]|uniref:glycosyltransferase family 2 protein n=1 Tax=Brevibacillus laterosporus TaxID=1465 RepID=UPI0003B1C07C|nr:glycosyltransferase family A protein [Brevibacillus laterosporus]ERM19217.1 glycosyl transferase [Brevibacillus laterosporus PE36]
MTKDDSKELPKVSILIPTYNRPHYFELALQSALAQNYSNLEIIVGDDSTNDETEQLIKPYLEKHPQLIYSKNPQNLGQFENDLKLLELASGEYINFLMDDDLFHPEKISRMMVYFQMDHQEEIALVTSKRAIINETGAIQPDIAETQTDFLQDTILDGDQLINMLLGLQWGNFIGEPTTVLFRKKYLTEPFGTLLDRKYTCTVDMASWIVLLRNGKGVYMTDTLSYFRMHPAQQVKQHDIIIGGSIDLVHLVLQAAPLLGYLQEKDTLIKAYVNTLRFIHGALYVTDPDRESDDTLELRAYQEKITSHLFEATKSGPQ